MMNASTSLLLVDDDKQFSLALTAFLQAKGYLLHYSPDASKAINIIDSNKVDLLLLDLNLPDEDGLVLLRQLQSYRKIPVIIISGRSTHEDRIVGLELGAVDYMVKPFSPKELALRIEKRLEHEGARSHLSKRKVGPYTLDIDCHALVEADCKNSVALTRNEFHILSCMSEHPGRVFSRELLIDACANADGPESDRAVDLLISRLRKKIETNPKEPKIILTVKGFGYKLSDLF